MTLENLIREIEEHSRREIADLEARDAQEAAAVGERTRAEMETIRSEWSRRAEQESQRERARILAAAKLQGKRESFEARERRTAAALARVRALLEEFTRSPQYAPLLTKMAEASRAALGEDTRFYLRSQDLPLLPGSYWRSVDSEHPLEHVMGGLVAETRDGRRRLNLTFDEILRLKEDQVREVLDR